MSDDPAVTSFANHVLNDWHDAMDHFFRRVYGKKEARRLTDAQVYSALYEGYGDEVASEWKEWSE